MSYAWTRWTLFIAMAIFVPLFFFMFVVAGFFPWVIMVFGAVVTLNIVFAVHALVYGLLLYGLSTGIALLVFQLPPRARLAVTIVLVLMVAGLGYMPVFGLGHNNVPSATVFDCYTNDRSCM